LTDTLLVLGQSSPVAGVLTALYTVPSATSATISSLIVCNTQGGADYFSISVAVGGSADNIKQYIYGVQWLDTNDTFIATVGITLASSDVVRCLSMNGNLSFSLFGVQIT
jgi:hypothetical protein